MNRETIIKLAITFAVGMILVIALQQTVMHLLWPNSFEVGDLYASVLEDVYEIEIRSGSTGEVKIITDEKDIREIAKLADKVKMDRDLFQSDREGYSYSLTFYSNKDRNEQFTVVIGGSTLSDNFRDGETINYSPYYKISNEKGLLVKLEALFAQ